MGSQPRMAEPAVLWRPSAEQVERANLTRYRRWLASTRGLQVGSYQELWRWSVDELAAFWASVWDFFEVGGRPAPAEAAAVLPDRRMPGTRWFPGATLNYAEHALRRRDGQVAVRFAAEDATGGELTRAELAERVGAAAAGLRRLGVGRGDRVVAYLPNIPETLIAFLATASIGAIWSSCAPEFGASSVLDRFQQIQPKVLLAVDGYRYGGRRHDRRAVLADIRRRLPTLAATVLVGDQTGPADPGGQADQDGLPGAVAWAELVAEPAEPVFEPVAFDHPLWVLYSSGTTGLPKAIVQGHGGILLEHLKALALHLDLRAGDRFFWYTTTGWMMWNFLVGGLLVEATVLLYDGSPAVPDMTALWRFAEDAGMTYFGTSAAYVLACAKAGIEPGRDADLGRLRAIGSTGSPLPPEGFRWLAEHVGADIPVGSLSGGTDVCTAFVGPCPLLPVYEGEIQCRTLGSAVHAFDAHGRPVVDEVGELVLTEPLPSMPLYFWNDPDGTRLRASYFEDYPGVWRHGDWVRITARGTVVISGRSDATLNRGGVRMGTAEFYRVVEALDEVTDSLVVDVEPSAGEDRGSGEGRLPGEGRLLLFVVLRPGVVLDDALAERIRQGLRTELSPRHVPDEIHAIPEVPRTLSGKKVEVPVKRVLGGVPLAKAVAEGALANPAAVHAVLQLASGDQPAS